MPDNRVRILASLDDKVSSGLDKIRDKLDAVGGKGTGSVAFGVVAAKGFGLIEHAAEDLIGTLFEAAGAARLDEESQSRLSASLKANVNGWDGNTAAIEKVIQARRELGFSDEEQRISLAGLVGATHSVSKALDVQRVAMDLARYKGISLADAGEALTKVEAGSYRILKSLGIVLKDGANQTDALAAVEKIATGQAEEFAKTNSGKLAVSQDKVAESMEKLGYIVMPALSDAMGIVAEGVSFVAENLNVIIPIVATLGVVFVSSLIPGLLAAGTEAVITAGGFTALAVSAGASAVAMAGALLPVVALTGAIIGTVAVLTHLTEIGDAVNEFIGNIPGPWHHATESVVELTDAARLAAVQQEETADSSTTMAEKVKGAANLIGDSVEKVADRTKAATDRMVTAFVKLKDSMLKDAQDTVSGYYDVLITQDKLAATNAEIAAQKRIIHSRDSTASQIKDARERLHELGRDQAQYMQDLAQGGATGSAIFTKNMEGYLKRLQNAHGDEREAILAEIRAIELLSAKAYNAAQAVATAANGGNLSSYGGGRASGGPVASNTTYTVGEDGPETLVMGATSGYIIPSVPQSSSGVSGSPVVIQLQVAGETLARIVDERLYYALQTSAATSGRA